MDADYLALKAENERLRAQVAALEAQVQRLLAENQQLLAANQKLLAALEQARREGKRQAAPFRKPGGPKPNPKKPGRKPGDAYGAQFSRPAPQQIDERYDAPLPACCPHCGGMHLHETRVAVQYQTDIPRRPIHRQFDVHLGVCDGCGRRVQGRHTLQTSDALGAAAVQLGPDAHAALAVCNKELGLSHGKAAGLLATLFGLKAARATSARSIQRTARRGQAAYAELPAAIRGSPVVTADETGWRVGGRNAWLHTLVTPEVTWYGIAAGRGAEAAAAVLGWDYAGVLVHDGWSAYDRFAQAEHQQCVAHLLRRCQEMLATAVGGAARLPRRIIALVQEAFAVRRAFRAGELDADEQALRGLELEGRLEAVVNGRFRQEENRRLARHVDRHRWNWFWFLFEPRAEATNWRAEQALRPAVVNRKVWGGNRTWRGAWAQSVLMSLLRTCRNQRRDPFQYLSQTLRSKNPLTLMS